MPRTGHTTRSQKQSSPVPGGYRKVASDERQALRRIWRDSRSHGAAVAELADVMSRTGLATRTHCAVQDTWRDANALSADGLRRGWLRA